MNDLQNKVAMVTGGAQGIGYAICEALGTAGCYVVVTDIREERMRESAENLIRLGCRCETFEMDVTKEESVQTMVRRVKRDCGRIDILVNSAGVSSEVVPTIRLPTLEWIRVLNVNLLGVFLCCREVGALMVGKDEAKSSISPP